MDVLCKLGIRLHSGRWQGTWMRPHQVEEGGEKCGGRSWRSHPIPGQSPTSGPETHLLHEVAEEDGFLPQWVVHQPIGEEDHALWEVVLGQP